jgi:ABC-type arginine/histidine transport system permease subunit
MGTTLWMVVVGLVAAAAVVVPLVLTRLKDRDFAAIADGPVSQD